MNAPLPANEAERVKALHAYGILDTESEQDYDDLVALASYVAACPIAVVSLVDANRQWFKARIGLGARETSREMSICAHAILTPNEPLLVGDTLKDVRFAQNSNVLGEPHIRFYAGIPLVTDAGLALGTLCVMDRQPREISLAQTRHLATLARQVSQMMELRRVSQGLAAALDEVKTLEGLLPICCQCKAIRDEDGKWIRLEGYVMARTAAHFTHGFCPTCAATLYPEFDTSVPDGPPRK